MESLNRSGHFKKGIKCCDKALKLNPHDSIAWRYKGLMQRNLGEMKNGTFREGQVRGDKEKALTYWRNALDDPWSLYYYGSTLWELNRIKESIPYLQRSLKNPPNQTIQGEVSDLLSFYEDLVKQGRI
jgi:tetratricopeptide (TPR) repeat protein